MGENPEDSFWEGLGYTKSGRKKVVDTQFVKALTTIGKIAPETWRNINESIQGLNRFMELGGTSGVTDAFTTIADSLKETLNLSIQDALSPLTNEINQFITDALAPVYKWLDEIANNIAQFVSENKTGATIGGIAGTIIQFLGGPAYIAIIGAVIGAAIEWLLNQLRPGGEMIEEAFKTLTDYLGEELEAKGYNNPFDKEKKEIPYGFTEQVGER